LANDLKASSGRTLSPERNKNPRLVKIFTNRACQLLLEIYDIAFPTPSPFASGLVLFPTPTKPTRLTNPERVLKEPILSTTQLDAI